MGSFDLQSLAQSPNPGEHDDDTENEENRGKGGACQFDLLTHYNRREHDNEVVMVNLQ